MLSAKMLLLKATGIDGVLLWVAAVAVCVVPGNVGNVMMVMAEILITGTVLWW